MYKFTNRLLLLVMMMLPMLAMSQVRVSQMKMESGTNATKWITLPEDTTITKTLLAASAGDAAVSELANIGFDFMFAGNSYSQFSVNTDGNLSLGPVVNTSYAYSRPFGPTNILQNLPKINGFGCDGMVTSDGYVKYAVTGVAPNRVLVVEYKIAKYNRTAPTSDVTWQVQLFEGSNEIQFVYGAVAPETIPSSFQIGIAAAENDVLVINTTFNTVSVECTNEQQTEWPEPNTFYRFYAPTCTTPYGLEIVDVTTNSADFKWNNTPNQTTWEYVCVESEIMPEWVTSQTATDTAIAITNLRPNTDYTLYLRTWCDADEMSDEVSISFHTNCTTLPIPYMDGFESYQESSFPYCWTSFNGGSSIEGSSIADNHYSGGKSLEITANDIVVAPRVKLLGNEMMLLAYIKAENVNAGTLEIGYVTDLETMDFTSLLTIVPEHTQFQEYLVDYSDIDFTDTAYIAFKETAGGSSWYSFMIDDITIDRASACYRPGYAFVSEVTHNTATVEWEANALVASYEVAYSLSENLSDATIISTLGNENSLVLSELLPNTVYHVWVRSHCDDEYSMWRSAGSFETKSMCASVINVNVSSIGNTTAAINWTIDGSYGNTATSVELSYKLKDSEDWTIPISIVNQNYYILNDLQGGYTYEVRLRTVCGNDSANYAMTTFTTEPCGFAVGNGDMDTPNLPFGGEYKYAYSQMLYPASELTGIDTIRGISFRVSEAMAQNRLVDVYMGNIHQSTLSQTSPIPVDSMDIVALNSNVLVEPGWVSIIFNTYFVYDGSSNLVVAIDDNTYRIDDIMKVYYHTTGSSLYRRTHFPNINPTDVNNLSLSAMSGTPDIMFISDCQSSACSAPMVAITDVSENSIMINWEAGTTETQWVVEYKEATANQWNSELTSATSYTISNLNSSTLYDVRVGALCGGDTLYTDLQILTNCTAYPIPFVENFDDSELNCWTIGVKPNGVNKLEWLADEGLFKFGNKDASYIVTPSLVPDLNTLQVQFSVGSINTYNNGALYILAGSNPNNFNTFVPIDTIYVAANTAMNSQIVSMENYSGDGHYVMFASFMGNFKLDNIIIDEIPQCSMPSDLMVSEITSDGGTISWTDDGETVVKWLVSYLKLGETIPIVFEVPSDDGPIHFATGLEPNTEYQVMVSTVCENGDTVAALNSITFRTGCAAVALPYNESFDGIEFGDFDICWYRNDPTSLGGADLPYWNIQSPAAYLGEHGSTTVVMSDNEAIVSPMIPIPANQISVNFNMKAQDTAFSGDMVIGFTTTQNDYATMTVVDTIEINNTDWNNYTIEFNNLSCVDTGYVVFKNINNEYYGSWNRYYYMIWLDDIDFSTYSSCVRPYNVAVKDITSDAAQVMFSDSTNAGSYTVAWNTVQDVSSALTQEVTTTTTQLNNLLPGNVYYVWVRSNCSATEHSSWVMAGKIKTQCDAIEMPYVENFDIYNLGVITDEDDYPLGYPSHIMPNCWNVIGYDATEFGKPTAMITSSSSDVVSGNGLYAVGSTDDTLFMVLPKFVPDIDSLLISFDYKNKTYWGVPNEFVLGVMTDPNNTATFMAVKDIPNVTNFTAFEYAFAMSENLDANTDYYIAFRLGGVGTNYQKLYLDNLMVDYAPSCLRPVDLSITAVSSTTATIEWMGLSNNYEVNYRAVGSDAWSSVMSNTNSIALTNLTANSSYELRVRGVCGVGDSSDWSQSFNFLTLCVPASVPWAENFETYIEDVSGRSNTRPSTYPNHAMPECWTFSEMTSSSYGGPAIWLSSVPNTRWNTHNIIEGVSLFMVSHAERPTYAVLPAMAPRIDSLAIYFEYAMSSSADSLEIGVATNPYDINTYISLEKYPVYDTAHSGEHYFIYDNLDVNQDYYIVFKAGMVNNSDYVIDNIRVEYLPDCIRPRYVKVTDLSNSEAEIHWSTLSNTSEISYHAEGNDTWTTSIVNADSVRLTGLVGNTVYEMAVRSICSIGDTSAWSDTISFLTECDIYTLPFIEDFSVNNLIGKLTCWKFYQGLYDDVMTGSASLVEKLPSRSNWKLKDNLGPFDGTNAYINIYGVHCNDWFVTPQIDISTSALLSFNVAFTEYHDTIAASDFEDDRFYVLASTDDGDTWTKVLTWSSDSTDTYSLDSLTAMGDSVGVSLNHFIGQTIRLAFYAESTVSGGDNDIYVGNIKIEPYNSCEVPTNIVVTPTPLSAELTWEGEGQNYEVIIMESTTNTLIDSTIVSGLTYSIDNLVPNTTYTYSVRQLCTEEMYSNWVSGVFTTLDLPCETPTITVDNISGYSAIVRWSEGENHTSCEVHVFNTMIDESYDVEATAYTISGLDPATEYSVAVRAKCTESIYSEWSDTIHFTTLDCYPVTNVVASEITQNSAVITWTPGGGESEWLVNYGDMDFSQGDGILVTVRDNQYTMINLVPESYYDVYVRAVCGDQFNSTWSEPVCQFQTLSDDTPEGIDGVEGNFQFVIYPNPTSGATSIKLNGIEGEVSISVVDMNGRTITTETINCGSNCEKRFDVAGLSQGTYFVRVLGDGINSVRKLIVR